MESKLPNLFSHQDHYMQSFKEFSSQSAKFSVYAEWGDTVFSRVVLPSLRVRLSEQEELRVLGVGSGSGEMECVMLGRLLQQFPRINNRAVEPLQEQLVQYKQLAKSKADELQGVYFDWRQQTIEQYEKAGDATKFHLISSVHSLYDLDNPDSSLMYLYNRLEPGGVVLLVIISDESGFARLWSPVAPFHSYSYISSADVRNSLNRRGIPYTQHRHRRSVDITECFDETSEKGSLLLDFLVHVTKFKETATEDLQRRVLERLASSECSKKSGDDVLLNADWDAIVISKPL